MPTWAEPPAETDALLRTAIEEKRLVELSYLAKLRIVEPHDYGVHNGVVKLLAYQVGGANAASLRTGAGWK